MKGEWLDWMILWVFSNLSDSMIAHCFLALSKVSMFTYMKKQIKQLELNKSQEKQTKKPTETLFLYTLPTVFLSRNVHTHEKT